MTFAVRWIQLAFHFCNLVLDGFMLCGAICNPIKLSHPFLEVFWLVEVVEHAYGKGHIKSHLRYF